MDIISMREVDRRLPKWNYDAGRPELALWHLDQRVNDRGFQADLELAEAAIGAVAVEQARLKRETVELTDGEVTSPSRRDQLLVHILMEYGVTLPDMKADTLRRRMEDPELPEAVKLLLAIRLDATRTDCSSQATC
jgi:DNA polymerase